MFGLERIVNKNKDGEEIVTYKDPTFEMETPWGKQWKTENGDLENLLVQSLDKKFEKIFKYRDLKLNY
jgi:hypothetical protein